MLFVIISTERSQSYTKPTLDSLLRNTDISHSDSVLIIDNDATLPATPGAQVIRHKQPFSFAKNANLALSIANAGGQDLALLNNDIIFTPGWLDYLRSGNITDILIPMSNQNIRYSYRSLTLNVAMDFSDFRSKVFELNQIARLHRKTFPVDPAYFALPLMPFFCAIIPRTASAKIGKFDETFGRGGGEDVDYRIRALLAGVNVWHSSRSYVLHFMGKSTWRSGEPTADTKESDQFYREGFSRKWGEKISRMFLAGGNKITLAEELGIKDLLVSGKYEKIINYLSVEINTNAIGLSTSVRS